MVQWLRLHAPNAGDVVQSLVRELKSHMPHSTTKITKIIILKYEVWRKREKYKVWDPPLDPQKKKLGG